jgi:hypothetical protein
MSSLNDLLTKIRDEFGQRVSSQAELGEWLVSEQGFRVEEYEKEFPDMPDVKYVKDDLTVFLKDTSYIKDTANPFVVLRASYSEGAAYLNLAEPDERRQAA